MNYKEMTKAELIGKLKSLESSIENSRYRSLFENTLNGIAYHKIIVDENNKPIDYKFLDVNNSFEILTGLQKDFIIGKRVTEVIPSIRNADTDLIEIYGKVALTGVSTHIDVYFKPLKRWFSISVYSPQKEYFVTVFDNITKRKKNESRLKKSENRFRDVATSMSDWIWEVDAQAKYTYVSGSFKEILGYNKNELLGKTPFDLMLPEEAKRIAGIFSEISSDRRPIVDIENWNRTKDGRDICLLTNGVPMLDNEGRLLGYRGVDKDITERKQTEKVLNKYRILFDNISDLAYICDTEGNILFLNKVFEKISGHKPEEFIGKSFAPLFDKDNLKKAMDLYTRTLKGESPREEIYYKDTGVLCEFQNRPLRDEKGVIVGVIGIGRDISERKRVEEKIKKFNEYLEERVLERTEDLAKANREIRDREARFQSILSSLHETGIVVNDKDGNITELWGTPEMDERYGVRAADLVGKNIRDILPPEQTEKKITVIRHIFDTGKKLLIEELITLPGGDFWQETSYCPMRDSKGNITAVVGFIRDITERKHAEDELKRIFDLSIDMICIADINNYFFTKINPSFCKTLGYSEEELLSRPLFDYIHPDDKSPTLGVIEKKLSQGVSVIDFENRYRCKDGSYKWLMWTAKPAPEQGITYAIARDITDRRQLEDERLRLIKILEMTTDFVGIASKDADVAYINRSGKNMIGWGDDFKPYSKKIQDAHPEWAKHIVMDEAIPSAIKNGVWEGETALIKYDGTEIPVSQVIISHKSPKGDVEFLSTIIRDITELKQTEKALNEASELNKRIISELPIGFSIYDQTGQCIEANASIAKMINATREQVLAQNYKNIESWKRSGLLDAANKSIRLRENERHEFAVVTTYDKHAFFDCTFVPFISNGEQHLLLIMDEITERKQTEERLAKKNSYLKLLQVAAVAANEAVDIKDAFQPILKEICSYTGWEIGHAYAASEDHPDLLKPTEVWCLEEKKQFKDFCAITKKTDFSRGVGLPGRVLASGKPRWIVDVRTDKGFLRAKVAKDLNIKSGIAFPVMVGSHVVAVLEFFTTMEVEPDLQLMGIMAEVGTQLGRTVERKQAEEELKKFKFISDNSNDGHFLIDKDSMFLYVNKVGCKMLGYSENELLYLSVPDVDIVYNKAKYQALFDLIQKEKVLPFETTHKRKDETVFQSEVSSMGIRIDGRDLMFSVLRDITDRKQMEEALFQSEKMKAMGIMTAGVAHEFNNILAVISSNAQLLEEIYISDNALLKSLRTICRMADDGAEIVDRMYDFTNVHKDTSHYKSVDLNDLIKQVIGFTMPRWKEMAHASGIKYQIVWKGAKALPSVLGNPSELREVILNIINNALDAMPGGGKITVKTRCIQSEAFGVECMEEKDSKRRTQNAELKSDFLEITFTDTGNGMSDELKKKMFDPFFTTRSPEGTGLGMSISYGIITRHGGKLTVKSKLGKGCAIIISLPVADKSLLPIVTSRQNSKLNIEGLKILLVDDKEEICESLGKVFKDDGHKVCTTNNGADALRLLKRNSYDLLICDLIMPDVNGRDIVNSIKTMKKRPKVGLITGWRYKMEDAEKEGLEVDFIVKKPFNLSKLRRDINGLWI